MRRAIRRWWRKNPENHAPVKIFAVVLLCVTAYLIKHQIGEAT